MATLIKESQEVVKVELKPDAQKKYVEGIMSSISTILQNRTELENKWRVAVKQYHGALQREDAGPGDSELDVPSTRQFAEAAMSRLVNPIFQYPQIFVGKPRKPEMREFASAVEDFCDYVVDRISFRKILEQAIRQAQIFTKCVVKVPHTYKTKVVRRYEKYDEKELEEYWEQNQSEPSSKFKEVREEVVERVGAFPEVVNCPDIIHPRGYDCFQSMPWVVHRVWLTRDEIRTRIRQGVYEKKTRDGKNMLDVIGHPETRPDPELSISLEDDRKDEFEDGTRYEVFEIYTEFDDKEVILTVERESKAVLRFIENFYHDFQRPFISWSWERVLNEIDGISLCYILEPQHRALSAILNQRLDAASKAMQTLILYTEAMGLERHFKEGKIVAGAYAVPAVTDIQKNIAQFSLSQPYTQIESLENSIREDQQKLAGLTPYNQGIEQIQRPTATGQMALIQEGKQPGFNRLENFRIFLQEMMHMIIARYRQYWPEEFVYYREVNGGIPGGEQDLAMVKQILEWPKQYWLDQVYVETAVSSQSMNQDLRKQEWLALVDKMPQVFQQIIQLVQISLEPSAMSPVAAQLLTHYLVHVVQPWMKEFEIAGKEFMDLQMQMQVGQMFQQIVQELQGQVQQMGASLEGATAQIAELESVLDHVTSAYIANTGQMPPPPPAIGSEVAGPSQAAAEAMAAGSAPA